MNGEPQEGHWYLFKLKRMWGERRQGHAFKLLHWTPGLRMGVWQDGVRMGLNAHGLDFWSMFEEMAAGEVAHMQEICL